MLSPLESGLPVTNPTFRNNPRINRNKQQQITSYRKCCFVWMIVCCFHLLLHFFCGHFLLYRFDHSKGTWPSFLVCLGTVFPMHRTSFGREEVTPSDDRKSLLSERDASSTSKSRGTEYRSYTFKRIYIGPMWSYIHFSENWGWQKWGILHAVQGLWMAGILHAVVKTSARWNGHDALWCSQDWTEQFSSKSDWENLLMYVHIKYIWSLYVSVCIYMIFLYNMYL